MARPKKIPNPKTFTSPAVRCEGHKFFDTFGNHITVSPGSVLHKELTANLKKAV